MKKMKKIFALLIAMVMVLGMSTSVFAQTVGTAAEGKGSITISNASKGETYTIYKLFDAKVTGTSGGSIAYTGTVPESLQNYFRADSAGNIHHGKVVDGEFVADTSAVTDLTSDEIAALTAWAKTATKTADAVSDGSELTFTGIDYGYYVVTTTQGNTAISVNSTNPDVTIIDKNTTPPVNNLGKKVAETDEIVSIGDTITYTISFATANYDGEDQIDKYVITDTLPEFLSDVTVTSIKVIEAAAVEDDPETEEDETAAEQSTTLTTQQFDANKQITITWAQDGQNLYKNGSTIEITYTAKVNDKVDAGNVETNKNEVTVQAYSGDNVTENGEQKTTETIQTYAAALQKTDETGADLAGATFQVPGLTVSGEAGNYTVVSYDPTSTADGTTMECDPTGFLVIRGLSNEAAINITEVAPPDGYNKLTAPVTLPVTVTSTTTTTTVSTESKTIYYDSDGNVVDEEVEGGTTVTVEAGEITTNDDLVAGAAKIQNQKGAELPSTGGIGTTIFYVIGAILVIGAGVVLVTRRRMNVQ